MAFHTFRMPTSRRFRASLQTSIVVWGTAWTAASRRSLSTSMHAEERRLDTGDKKANGLCTSKTKRVPLPSRRVYILGLGNIGCFVAHSLRSIPNPPRITLLLHNENLYEQWWKEKRRVTLIRHGLVEHARGFDVSVARQGNWYIPSQPAIAFTTSAEIANDPEGEVNPETEKENPKTWTLDEEPIENLILACKATQVEKALQSVAHRILPTSTIVFLQNGMGIIDEVNEKIFTDAARRPSYITGVVSHGLYRVEPFKAVLTGVGTTVLAVTHTNPHIAEFENTRDVGAEGQTISPPEELRGRNYVLWSHTSRYLISLLCRTPALTASTLDKTAIMSFQLEKLAMNCVINPLTALFNCKNGELLTNFNVSRIQRLLLIEVAAVARAMPELEGMSGLRVRFSPERLRILAVGLEQTTAENTSSMLQDTLANRETEINYINGYIVRRGDELGIRCVANYMLVQAVLAKTRLASKASEEVIPFEHLEEYL
ncbi:hypothetical protein KEM54_001088 [Ascosphaera aggregata]|nr:hypothetical protein KEM54_001088 [Ascosphaera aggregata]